MKSSKNCKSVGEMDAFAWIAAAMICDGNRGIGNWLLSLSRSRPEWAEHLCGAQPTAARHAMQLILAIPLFRFWLFRAVSRARERAYHGLCDCYAAMHELRESLPVDSREGLLDIVGLFEGYKMCLHSATVPTLSRCYHMR